MTTWYEQHKALVALYRAAMAADARFRDLLVEVYGEKEAGDARYRRHHDPRLRAAAEQSCQAFDAWQDAYRTARRSA